MNLRTSRFPSFTYALMVACVFWHIPANAHEFWVLPSAFKAAPGAPLTFSLHVGEHFEGEDLPLNRQYVQSMRHYSSQGEKDLTAGLTASGQSKPGFSFEKGGVHMLAIDTYPNKVSLSADRFHAYLHEEGLDSIIKMREAAGKAKTPGRERYRRHIKTLLSIDGQQEGTAVLRTGQRLEILPLAVPAEKLPGDTMDFQMLFDGKPLENALVKTWQKRDGQTVLIRALSSKDGTVRISLPYAGTWMMSVVHMIPATGSPEFDWESFWGNLTFELPSKRPQ